MQQKAHEAFSWKRCIAATWPTLLALLLVFLLFGYHWLQLRDEGLLARFDLISDEVGARTSDQAAGEKSGPLAALMRESGFPVGEVADFTMLLRVQQWVGDLVPRIESPTPGNSSAELLVGIQAGRGLLCGGMAQLLQDAASLLRVPVRRVQLYRSDFERFDTHVLVEVRLGDGHWVALDPTFNLSFRDDQGRLLGVAEIRRRLGRPDAGEVIPVYHGDRRYPARVDSYYLDWRMLYGNAYVVDGCAACTTLERLPPFRYWYGPVRYVYGEQLGSLASQHNRYYFLTVVIFPLVLALLSLVLLIQLIRCGRH